MSFGLRILARRAATMVAIAGISLMSACGDSTGPDGDVYALFSVDGFEMPSVYTDYFAAGDVFTIKGGTLVLNDGKYTVRVTNTYKASPSASLETFVIGENGTYVENGTDLTLTSTHDFEDGQLFVADPPTVTTAVKNGDTITADVYDVDTDTFLTFVFKKN